MAALVEIAPGAVFLPSWLPLPEQVALLGECRRLIDAPVGGYVPLVRGGGRMHVRMLCLGRHWNPVTYTYGSSRRDYDGAPVPPVPSAFAELARRLAADAGMAIDPDICLLMYYPPDGRMGVHRDKDESAASVEAGIPVVSLSVGDTARFMFGGMRRRDPMEAVMLASGDGFVFGGPARLRYHGVARIMAGTAPAVLGFAGRFNLTFRQY